MVELRIAKHCIRDVEIVEIYVDGVFSAAIYPQEPNVVRLVSTHLDGDPHAESGRSDAWCFAFRKPGTDH